MGGIDDSKYGSTNKAYANKVTMLHVIGPTLRRGLMQLYSLPNVFYTSIDGHVIIPKPHKLR